MPTEWMLSIKHLDWSKLLTLHPDTLASELSARDWEWLSLAWCGLESRKGLTPGAAARMEEEGF